MATPFDHTSLESLEVGAAPVVRHFLDRLQFEQLLARHLPPVTSTALSLQHGAKICDAFSVILFASGLLQEPVTDAAMHFRQWQAPTVGPTGRKGGGCRWEENMR